MKKSVYIASTGQHVGKTTTCLGLLSGLRKRYKRVGFMKPVGQEHVPTDEGVRVDKDVALFKTHYDLPLTYHDMSPVLFPRGFTRDFIDGKVNTDDLEKTILDSYQTIAEKSDFVLCEGTGHVGVGSIVELNNAEVARHLGLKVIMIASGGLGSSFDALALNKFCCDAKGVQISGVILNRVLNDKREMILDYMGRALSRWNIPILGCIPFDPFLSKPSMKDFEALFNSTLLSGEQYRLRHFRHTRLASTSALAFRDLITPSLLVIASATREDIVLAVLEKHWNMKVKHPDSDLEAGLILTGRTPPSENIIKELKKADVPMIYVPLPIYKALQMITSFTAKIRIEDKEKIHEAIHLVEDHIDFDKLISVL